MDIDKNTGNIPKDMVKGSKHGLLTLTGEWITDKFQNRKFECVCECGCVVHKCSKEIRKSKCCYIKNHPKLRKKRIMRKDSLCELKRKFIGKTIRNHTILDVLKHKRYVFNLRCNECGVEIIRRKNEFLKGTVDGCVRLHEEDIEKRKKEADKLKKANAKKAAKRLKERIKKNKGMYYYKDITGQKFGRLTAIEYLGAKKNKSGKNEATWKCKCECGETCVVNYSSLKAGRKLCDKELTEFKRQQGKHSAKIRVKNNRNKKIFPKGGFRIKNKKKLQQISSQVYDKYNGVCQKCKKIHPKKISHCHHIIPIAENKNLAFTLSNGILLCEDCHYNFHIKYGYVNFKPQDIFEFLRENSEVVAFRDTKTP